MEQAYLREFEAKCVQEEAPACQSSCPLHLDARAFVQCMQEAKLSEARKILDRTMPLSCLVAYLCESPCQQSCLRSKIDQGLDLALLERFCVSSTDSLKVFPLPATHKKIAIAGAELSSFVLAFELARKGHSLTIFYKNGLALELNKLSEEKLPKNAISKALEQLKDLDVDFKADIQFNQTWIEDILLEYPVIYLGLDDPHIFALSQDLDLKPENKISLATKNAQIFAGAKSNSFIQNIADAKRAAGSIDRFLQNVSPLTAREKEDVYSTLLYTDISKVQVKVKVEPKDKYNFSLEEAQAEAKRCIKCECLECVKKCAFLRNYKAYPKKYCREIYNNLSVVQGVRQANTMINSCAECGLCAVVCPQGLDMGAFCKLAKQEMVQVKRMPKSAHAFALEDMLYTQDLAFMRHQINFTSSQYLFFPGCQLPASRIEQTQKVYTFLQENLKGGVGFVLACCGAAAKWSGNIELTKQNAEHFRKIWIDANKPTVILACASCSQFFAEECPEIPCLSLWEILQDLPFDNLDLSQNFSQNLQLSLHDPCVSRHDSAMRASVRSILQKISIKWSEIELGQEYTRCCGYGGLAWNANPALAEKYTLDLSKDSDLDILSYCIMCRDRLAMLAKPSLHLLDLLFATESLYKAKLRVAPNISQRQENRLEFKSQILANFWQEKINKDDKMEALFLNISEEINAKLELRRILHSDIKTVILATQSNNSAFFNLETKHYLAAYRYKQVSYWVEYLQEPDGTYTIFDAYCHRMVVPGISEIAETVKLTEIVSQSDCLGAKK